MNRNNFDYKLKRKSLIDITFESIGTNQNFARILINNFILNEKLIRFEFEGQRIFYQRDQDLEIVTLTKVRRKHIAALIMVVPKLILNCVFGIIYFNGKVTEIIFVFTDNI